jgi:hypothetical protein
MNLNSKFRDNAKNEPQSSLLLRHFKGEPSQKMNLLWHLADFFEANVPHHHAAWFAADGACGAQCSNLFVLEFP